MPRGVEFRMQAPGGGITVAHPEWRAPPGMPATDPKYDD
jgi:hypothetical protein